LIKLCYTQIENSGEIENYHDFYQLLRYNEAILRMLPINLVVTDNENKIKMINDHGKAYFKIKKVYPKTLFIDDLLGPDNNKALDLIKSAFRDKKENTFYNIPMNIDGNQNVTNVKILPIYDGPFLIGNITIIEDISRQEELAAAGHPFRETGFGGHLGGRSGA
jgi:sensor histidine kinase regulating citrate/malate metabolism